MPPRPSQLIAPALMPADTEMTAARAGRRALAARPLTDGEQTEVLAFLAARPAHTVIMSSFIRDNKLEGAGNRGTYYGYRNARGELRGVALFGHTLLFEARDEAPLRASAPLPCREAHMIIAASETLARVSR